MLVSTSLLIRRFIEFSLYRTTTTPLLPTLTSALPELMHLCLTLVYFGPRTMWPLYHLAHSSEDGIERFVLSSPPGDHVIPEAYGRDPS